MTTPRAASRPLPHRNMRRSITSRRRKAHACLPPPFKHTKSSTVPESCPCTIHTVHHAISTLAKLLKYLPAAPVPCHMPPFIVYQPRGRSKPTPGGGGHEATDTQLLNAPVTQATGHSSQMVCCTVAPFMFISLSFDVANSAVRSMHSLPCSFTCTTDVLPVGGGGVPLRATCGAYFPKPGPLPNPAMQRGPPSSLRPKQTIQQARHLEEGPITIPVVSSEEVAQHWQTIRLHG